MTEIGTIIEGKYEILKEIGRGGMSTVYLAMDKRLNKQWAVKEIRKRGSGKNEEIIINSLLTEANLMKRLDNPALPRIVDIIDNGITIYVIMDYIEGESLDKIMKISGPQPEELVIGWAKQLCDALSYLHSQKPPIIYRDMKPSNVMLKPEGNIKIIDFGIAREYKEQNLSDTTVLGTKGYAPPEQYSGQTDPRSDIYALGMTMHHLLTGVDPRNGEAYIPVRQWNPELSEGIEAIIDKCVQPAPENRYQNCADLLYDLEHPQLITKGFKRKQKRRLILFVAAISLSILMLITGFVTDKLATRANNNTYEALVESEGGTVQERTENYKRAIEIYPNDPRAYIAMLEAYEEDGKFDTQESAEFEAVFNPNISGFDASNPDVAELYFKIGTMYYNYYDVGGYSAKINKALPLFERNHNNTELVGEFENQELSECYYTVCSFYKKFIGDSSNIIEAARSDYDDLLTTLEEMMDRVESLDAYNRLNLYNCIGSLLYACRDGLQSTGVELDRVLTLFDSAYEKAKTLSVQKDQSKTLQEEIIDNFDEYREKIVIRYSNAERGNG